MRSLVKLAAAVATCSVALFAAPAGHASLPGVAAGHVDASMAEYSTTAAIEVPMRNAAGSKMISRMLNESAFWDGAKSWDFKGELYDKIQLQSVAAGGYLPAITGEADEDIPHEVVADIVFQQQTNLPAYMDGCVAVETLGWGTDSKFGVPYLDNYFVLDFGFFYVQYTQRMYKRTVDGTTYLWFEKLDQSFVDSAKWEEYEAKKKKVMDGLDLRNFFGSVLPVGEIYGVFVVGKGQTRETRVTFVSRIAFGNDAGWLAKMGSKMPPVIKAGLQSGFDASVKIAKAERDRRQG